MTRDNVEDVDSDKNVAEMIKLLLDHRADTTLLTNGHSPLSLAIVSGNDTVGRALFSFPRKRGNMFSPALVCVCVCVCVSVCLSVTTIIKKIADGFGPNFMGRFRGGEGRPSSCFGTIGRGMWK